VGDKFPFYVEGRQMTNRNPLLIVKDLTKRFGGVIANNRISLTVYERELVGIIGPNGAGKTTLFNMISGVVPKGSSRAPTNGQIIFRGVDITKKPGYKIAKLGLARTFQVVRVFENLVVWDNVLIGALARLGKGRAAEQMAEEAMAVVGLEKAKHKVVRELTLAEKKRVELARALAVRPTLLLLDEILAGMIPSEVKDMLTLIEALHQRGITIVIVEHNVEALLSLVKRLVVLDRGEKIADGPPSKVVQSQRVISAYLGEGIC